MSARELREAASLLRERAEKSVRVLDDVTADIRWYTARDLEDEGLVDYDAAYLASMHPAFALAVASWLDYFGQMVEEQETPGQAPFDDYGSALAVAHQVLRIDASHVLSEEDAS